MENQVLSREDKQPVLELTALVMQLKALRQKLERELAALDSAIGGVRGNQSNSQKAQVASKRQS